MYRWHGVPFTWVGPKKQVRHGVFIKPDSFPDGRFLARWDDNGEITALPDKGHILDRLSEQEIAEYLRLRDLQRLANRIVREFEGRHVISAAATAPQTVTDLLAMAPGGLIEITHPDGTKQTIGESDAPS